MKIFRSRISVMVFCSAMLTSAVFGDGPDELLERLRTPLVNAGIGLDANSLINALNHKEDLIATRAALLLGREGKTKATVKALSEAATSEREVLAVAAVQSLLKLGERNWVPVAVSRLPKIKDRLQQIQLAGLLAQADSVDGWQVVKDGLLDPKYSPIALENLNAFEGKQQKDGKVIRVLDELQQALQIAPDSARSEIKREIDRRTKQKGAGTP